MKIKVLISIVSFLIGLVILECTLYFLGYRPGYFYNYNKYPQYKIDIYDSIYVLPFFYSDSIGMPKIKKEFSNENFDKSYFKSQNQILQSYNDRNINSDGFSTLEFDSIPSQKKKIILLGDSFTWGLSGNEYIDSTFAQHLQKFDTNATIINLSVPGIDIAGYEAIIDYYIDKIKPELVILNFYKNDFVFYDKKILPNEWNDIFLTNSGPYLNINYDLSTEDSIFVFKKAIDAHNYYVNKLTLFNKTSSSREIFFRSCNTLTQLYHLLFKRPILPLEYNKFKREDFTLKYLNRIINKVHNNHSQFILSIIPSIDSQYKINNKSISQYFSNVENLIIQKQYPDSFFIPNDGHFNSKAHKIYAESLYRYYNGISK